MRQSLLISHALTNSPSVARDVRRRIGGRRGSVLKVTLSVGSIHSQKKEGATDDVDLVTAALPVSPPLSRCLNSFHPAKLSNCATLCGWSWLGSGSGL